MMEFAHEGFSTQLRCGRRDRNRSNGDLGSGAGARRPGVCDNRRASVRSPAARSAVAAPRDCNLRRNYMRAAL